MLPVGVMLTAYALIARELARRYRHQRAGSRFADFPSMVVSSGADSLHGSTEDVGGVRVVVWAELGSCGRSQYVVGGVMAVWAESRVSFAVAPRTWAESGS